MTDSSQTTGQGQPALKLRLSLMMFLQYFIWGAWWVTLGSYMAATGFGDMIGRTYATQGWGVIISVLFIGMIADRFVAAEKLLGVLHIIGAILLYAISVVDGSASLFYGLVLLYMVTFMPTLPLSNAIAFNVMKNAEKEFPLVRVLGTVGWIVAGLVVGFLLAPLVAQSDLTIEQTYWPIRLAAVAALVMGIFSFSLPHTPPKDHGQPKSVAGLFGLDIFKQIRSPSFWVFIACSLLICIPLTFYYGYTNAFLVDKVAPNAVALQSLGQVSEILLLLLLPVLFIRLGIKYILLIGMLCWAARYILFAYGFEGGSIILPVILLGILLHGICYDFFFVAGQIYVDKRLPPETRARAQSFLALVTLGIGTLVGGELSNYIVNANTLQNVVDWHTVWWIPAILAIAVALLFAVFFKEEKRVE